MTSRKGVSIYKTHELALTDSSYPKLLKMVPDPPERLFFRGEIDSIDWEKSISVVGMRKMNNMGEQITHNFVQSFSNVGLATISGMAFGVDAAAHRQSILSGARTIAVLASPVDQPSPASHGSLYKSILESGGLILSETPPGQKYFRGTYLKRNRIISALSPSTIVIQAALRSGALSTATFAFNYARSVFAVPGSIYDNHHAGCNLLIHQLKAAIANSPADILQSYGLTETEIQLPQIKLTEDQKALIDLLQTKPMTPDVLLSRFDRTMADSLSLLSGLEIKGCIELADDGRYHVKSHMKN